MNIIILGKTSTESDNMIWVTIDDLEYGINENFDISSLQCDGTACDCIDSDSMAEYDAIAESIKGAVEERGADLEWI